MGRPLGQHFLIRQSALERIVSACCEESPELVIEIGPGKGALTRRLLARAGRVVAIELDGTLVERLRAEFSSEPRLTILHSDVLDVDLAQWGPAVLAGNLPYYITSPILERIFRARNAIRRAVLLVQKEVAMRLTAGPGTRDYGYLSVETQIFSNPRLLFPVPPAAFHPPPKVDSAAVCLDLKPAPPDAEAFLRFASLCFRHKRKTLRNNLSGHYPKPAVDSLPEARLRAEQMPVAALEDLFRRLGKAAPTLLS